MSEQLYDQYRDALKRARAAEQQLQEARALLERCYLALAKREGFYLSLPEHPEALAKAIRTFLEKEV